MNIAKEQKKLERRQQLPISEKIEMTKDRIREWYEAFNGKVFVSFSGGKDSTVLLHIVRQMYPEVVAVFCNTGLEYPEIVRFVRKFDNVDFVYPKKKFKEVIKEYGYPIISKKVAGGVSDVQNWSHANINTVNLRLYGWDKNGEYQPHWMIPKKWRYLCDAPFKISARCCRYLKKNPMTSYTKQTGKYGINAMVMEEGGLRVQAYLKYGCNSFDAEHPKSSPMAFWKLQDILQYIIDNNIEIAKCYGDVLTDENGLHYTSELDRTGCTFCMFGVHLDKEPNRFQRMKVTHPQLWDYCINKLDLKQCLDYINIPYE